MYVELMRPRIVSGGSHNTSAGQNVFNLTNKIDKTEFRVKRINQNPSFKMIADRTPFVEFDLSTRLGLSELAQQFAEFKSKAPEKSAIFETVKAFLLDLNEDAKKIGTQLKFAWRDGIGDPYICAIGNSQAGILFHQKKVVDGNIDGLYDLIHQTDQNKLKRFILNEIGTDTSFFSFDRSYNFGDALKILR